jgi:hypothetical protein
VAVLLRFAGLPAQDESPVVRIVASPEKAPAPAGPLPAITLHERHGHVSPIRQGFEHTGGGIIDVAQPAPDTVVVTMTGVAVAGRHPCKDSHARLHFDLEQRFEVVLDRPGPARARLTLEARVVGLLRSSRHGGGSAAESDGCATVLCGPAELVTLCAPAHSVTGGENLSINDHAGPVTVPVVAGKYTLHQAFDVAVDQPYTLAPCKAASAEFAPDPALDPLWISFWEPFHGALKGNFGLQTTLRVAPDPDAPASK